MRFVQPSHSPEETHRIARAFAGRLGQSALVALFGELGAGKTRFVQGLADGLGIRELVNSPTFTLINEYEGSRPLFHVDLYRVGSEDEALELGLEEYLERGIVAIEWPDRIPNLLGATGHWRVTIRPAGQEEQREIVLEDLR